MKAFVCQSNWIPWRGYFAAIREADIFVIYDNVQFSKGSWRNRNLVQYEDRKIWLTLPIQTGGKLGQLVDQVKVSEKDWLVKQCRKINSYYRFSNHYENLENLLLNPLEVIADYDLLTEINEYSLRLICELLEIKTKIVRIDTGIVGASPTIKLIDTLEFLGVDNYLSGPSARNYLVESEFNLKGIKLTYLDYEKIIDSNDRFSIIDDLARFKVMDVIKRSQFND